MVQNLAVKKRKTEVIPSRPIETDDEFEKLFSNSRILSGKCDDRSEERLQLAVLADLKTLSAKFDQLDFKEQNQDEMEEKLKFDFESEKGAQLCQDILQSIAKLFTTCQLKALDRSYREKFTNAYKLLYSRHGGQEQLCYLLEIMDSA